MKLAIAARAYKKALEVDFTAQMMRATTIAPDGTLLNSCSFKGNSLPLQAKHGIHFRFYHDFVSFRTMMPNPIVKEDRGDAIPPIFTDLCEYSAIANYNQDRELVSVIVFTSRESWLFINQMKGFDYMRWFMKQINWFTAPDLWVLANVAALQTAD